jgi:hypothetical protein
VVLICGGGCCPRDEGSEMGDLKQRTEMRLRVPRVMRFRREGVCFAPNYLCFGGYFTPGGPCPMGHVDIGYALCKQNIINGQKFLASDHHRAINKVASYSVQIQLYTMASCGHNRTDTGLAWHVGNCSYRHAFFKKKGDLTFAVNRRLNQIWRTTPDTSFSKIQLQASAN